MATRAQAWHAGSSLAVTKQENRVSAIGGLLSEARRDVVSQPLAAGNRLEGRD